MKKYLLLLLALLLMAALLTACGQPQAPAATDDPASAGVGQLQETETVYIGVLLPQTTNAVAAKRSRSAMELAADIINKSHDLDWDVAANAGIAAYGNAKVELRFADCGKTSADVYTAVRHFADTGIELMISACDTTTTAEAALVCDKLDMPLVCGSVSGAALTDGTYDLGKCVARIAATDRMEMALFMEYLEQLSVFKEGTIKNIAIAYENSEDDNRTLAVLEEALEEDSLNEVAAVSYEQGDTNLAEEAVKLTTNQPDVIFQIGKSGIPAAFVSSYAKTGYQPKAIICCGDGLTDKAFLSAIGSSQADYWYGSMVCPDPLFASDAEKDANPVKASSIFTYLSGQYRNKYKMAMDNNALLDMRSVIVMAQAVSMAGSADGKAVTATLRGNDFPAPYLYSGTISFDENGQNTVCPRYIARVEAGRYTYEY